MRLKTILLGAGDMGAFGVQYLWGEVYNGSKARITSSRLGDRAIL